MIDAAMAALLLKELPEDSSVASAFDMEVHYGQLLDARYNAI
jgi:hypothetical protein